MDIKKGNTIIHEGKLYIVREMVISSKNIKATLENFFSGAIIETTVDSFEEAQISRKCGSIIQKLPNKLEIMDSISFETIEADIDPELLAEATENDAVNYTKFGNQAKVLELRK